MFIFTSCPIFSAICFAGRLTLKLRHSRQHWYNYCSIRSIWCWVKPRAGITFLPPEIRVTTPGSLEAECPVTESNGFSLLVLHPLLKIMPYFRLLHVWIMTLLWRILFFGFSSPLEFLVAFFFPSCFYLPLSYLRSFHTTCSVEPLPVFGFRFYPLRTLSVPEPIGAASSAHLLPRDLSGLPFAALLGWNLLRKDTWKVDCLKMSVSYIPTEGRLPGSKWFS